MSSIYDLDKVKEEIQRYLVIRQDLMEEMNDARRGLELMFQVMDRTEFAKTQLHETEEKVKETKRELQETKRQLQETKRQLREEMHAPEPEYDLVSHPDDEFELV
jgi:hypothetical protein